MSCGTYIGTAGGKGLTERAFREWKCSPQAIFCISSFQTLESLTEMHFRSSKIRFLACSKTAWSELVYTLRTKRLIKKRRKR